MTLYEVPWIPRYVSATEPCRVLAGAVARTPGHAWSWIHAREFMSKFERRARVRR